MRAAKRSLRRGLLSVLIFCFAILLGVVSVSAQTPATPITIGENKTGSVTDPSVGVPFTLAVAAPQSVNIQVLAISLGFAPTFRVIDPGGIVVLDAANPGTQTVAQGSPNLSSPGAYTIEVFSANNTIGQFLISVQPGAPLAPPQPLTPGQPVNGTVNSQTTRQAYSFAGLSNDVLLLTVRGTDTTIGPVVALRDADTGETLSLSSASLIGASLRFPMIVRNYLLEVTHAGGTTPESFTICLSTESGSAVCPGAPAPQVVQPTAIPPIQTVEVVAPTQPPTSLFTPTFAPVGIDPFGPCMVASARGVPINVRSGPGLNYNVVGQLPPNATGLVLGRLADNSWFQVSVNGLIGWVSGTVVITGGNCAGVSVIVLPTATYTYTPTNTTTVEPTFTPTATLTPSITPTFSGTLHFPPIRVTLLAPIEIVPLIPKLDYTASPNYGEANLSAGFSPDPYSVGMTSGGNVDVSYLGGSCAGFATSAPDLRINFGGGGSSLLRIYFIGSSGDATIVVNDPYGNFYCVDDSFGTVNPTIDFNNPAGGSYDVWVGSYASGTYISGTLYLTENSGNHP
ncbi:MAG: SH3 domain-containing protein [Anaerolineae bacterium]